MQRKAFAAIEGQDRDLDNREGQQLSFQQVLAARLARRDVLKGSAGLAAGGLVSSFGLSGCLDGAARNQARLGFDSVAMSKADRITLPAGYQARVLFALGDPMAPGLAPYANNGTQSFEQRAGDHHDGMHFFSLPAGSRASDHGLLAMNHENITQDMLHPNGATSDAQGRRPLDEVRREMSAHGISIVEVADRGGFQVQVDSPWNRRITPNTPMQLSGPVAGSSWVQTRYSPAGTMTRGTLNNCANGYTPWGTYLTCEENWAGYFYTEETELPPEKAAYGVGGGRYGWHTASSEQDTDGEFARFDTTPRGASASEDYRNEASSYGWIVEIDPYDPLSVPVKRTALGRFGHEGCWMATPVEGQPMAFYMGDDSRGEYIYKFVTRDVYRGPRSTNGSIMDHGTLYVARFDADGRGEWIALDRSNPVLAERFADMAELLVNTRTAADLVGATPMDRPEWGAVNPANGEVYMTLTNNKYRGVREGQEVDAANPRNYDSGRDGDADADGNDNGHIIRWREDGDDAAATAFTWDIFMFGARPDAPAHINASGLDDSNAFSSPDGLYIDSRNDTGLIWIQTDDGAMRDLTNNQMLVAKLGEVGDGQALDLNGQLTHIGQSAADADLRRFLVGPVECEITGIDMTPDRRTLFINVQHPGENGGVDALTSHWPSASGDATQQGEVGQRPRSATIVITREDGGIIGV